MACFADCAVAGEDSEGAGAAGRLDRWVDSTTKDAPERRKNSGANAVEAVGRLPKCCSCFGPGACSVLA